MELFIKVYETCPVCKGTGWLKEEEDGNVLCSNCPVACGKVEKLIKVIDLYMYLKNKIEE